MTMKGVMKWAEHELKSVGYLVGVKDPDIQYAYAQSTVNGMLHLRDALFELINDPAYANNKEELTRMHDKVVRVVKHLIKDFNVKLEEIKTFNTHKVLSDLSYLNEASGGHRRKTQRNRRNTRKNSKNNFKN
jgi:hypothetical protein